MAKMPGEYDYNDKLIFQAEWFDYEASLQKKFLLSFYPSDNSLELYDRERNRTYLKRSKTDNLTVKDMFVGNTVRIYGRQIKITDFADCRTKNYVGKSQEHTFTLLKPSVIDKLGEIINQIENRQFHITKIRMCQLSRKDALDFYVTRKGDSFLPFTLEHVVSGPVVAMELVGENALERFNKNLGPRDPMEGRKTDPNSLRALYGEETCRNGFHASYDKTSAVRETEFFFPEKDDRTPPAATLQLNNSTCCIVKPHAIEEGKLGSILTYITEHQFKITALQMFYLSNANANEFLEVYKGVVSDFNALLLSFIDGPLVALEISGKIPDMNVHEEFRKFAGPSDSEVARQIRPTTIRARFGCDKYRNAVHCTDLPEDTVLELEYFFEILKK